MCNFNYEENSRVYNNMRNWSKWKSVVSYADNHRRCITERVRRDVGTSSSNFPDAIATRGTWYRENLQTSFSTLDKVYPTARAGLLIRLAYFQNDKILYFALRRIAQCNVKDFVLWLQYHVNGVRRLLLINQWIRSSWDHTMGTFHHGASSEYGPVRCYSST